MSTATKIVLATLIVSILLVVVFGLNAVVA
jgi:hypothetical protein